VIRAIALEDERRSHEDRKENRKRIGDQDHID
jgi:hypothetical protein